MSRRSPRASRLPAAYALLGGVLLLACWNGCEINRSGLSAGGDRPGGSGGQLSPFGTGGIDVSDTGGSTIHFGTGGAGPGTGGHPTGGAGGGPEVVGTGGTAGAVGSGGTASGGQGSGGRIFGSGGAAGQTVGTGGDAGGPGGRGGGSATRTGGRGGGTTSTGGSGGNWGSGGRWSGDAGRMGSTGGSDGGLPMCDPSIRDKDPCDSGTPDCRKSCGVSSMATKPCTCTGRQWACGDCVYPSGDYSCYQLPAMAPPPCPPSTVNGMTACVGNCTLCSNYMDTTGMPKMGYCACNLDPGDSARVYHCASSAEWPPQ